MVTDPSWIILLAEANLGQELQLWRWPFYQGWLRPRDFGEICPCVPQWGHMGEISQVVLNAPVEKGAIVSDGGLPGFGGPQGSGGDHSHFGFGSGGFTDPSSPLMHRAVHGTGAGDVGVRSSKARHAGSDEEDTRKGGRIETIMNSDAFAMTMIVFGWVILGAIIFGVLGTLIACDLLVPVLAILFLSGIVALGRFLG